MKAFFMDYSNFDVWTNMAIDEWAYKNIDTLFFRFYTFSKPSITIGYNQRYNFGIDFDYVVRSGIDITRRITGGRAVIHSGDLTYSFCGNNKIFTGGMGLIERYKKISEIFVESFKKMGIDASLSGGEKKESFSANCFASTSIFEINLKGEKIVGSAQTFSETNFLQQGSILVKKSSIPQEKIYGKIYTNNIENLTGIIYNIKDMSKIFYEVFFNSLNFQWERLRIDFNDNGFKSLVEKYRDEGWIKKR